MRARNRTVSIAASLLVAALGLAPAACVPAAPYPASAAPQVCPPWIDYPADAHSNQESPYLGCSNDVNLIRMVERPKDLEQGRTLGPASGERQANAIKNYNSGPEKPSGENGLPKQSSVGVTTGVGQ